MRKLLLIAFIATGWVVVSSAQANAFPRGMAPTVDCQHLAIDPPPQSFPLKVTFKGEVNGTSYTKQVTYGVPTPHIATVDISDLTTGTGPLHITSTATAPFLGTSETADVTITCHQEVTTTTSTSTSTTSTTTPTTTTQQAMPPTSVPAPLPELPHTGSSSIPLGAAAVAILTLGAALLYVGNFMPTRRRDR